MLLAVSKKYVHSTLFLASRALFLVSVVSSSTAVRTLTAAILLMCAAHQTVSLFLYQRCRLYDELKVSKRAYMHHIRGVNGPVAKLLAAFEAYLCESRTHPHLLNLLHWLEVALQCIVHIEVLKLKLAVRMDLIYSYDKTKKVLFYKSATRWSLSGKRNTQKLSFLIISMLSKRFPNIAIGYRVFPVAPSCIVWLAWLLLGRRKILAVLQPDPRERSYFIDSYATHLKRARARFGDRSVRPVVFGVDMSSIFEKGISRRIAVEDLEDPMQMFILLLSDVNELAFDENQEVDHETVFCISYRHLEDKEKEALSIVATFKIAAEISKQRGQTHFRVWMDKILRLRRRQLTGSWSEYGLLPYAYYPVIAARNMSADEGKRMWLLAEERLAYGNMGLFKVDVETMDLEYITGVNCGPENSFRIYLRYLKTGEAANEETFHESDRRQFLELADNFGFADDEEAIYQALSTGNISGNQPATISIWWPNILDVESYAPLRSKDVMYDEIVFDRLNGVTFDGYREWFRNKETRYTLTADQHTTDTGRRLESVTWILLPSFYFAIPVTAVYRLEGDEAKGIVLIHRQRTGTLSRTACVCLQVVACGNGFKVEKTTRIQLKYEEVPEDGAYLEASRPLFIEDMKASRIRIG